MDTSRDDTALAAFLARRSRAGVLTDFDGTLAAIVDRPEEARPLSGAGHVLRALAARCPLVAIVSGRPAAFVVDRLGLGPDDAVVVSGLYGMETATGGRVEARPEAERWRPVIEEAAVEAERAAPPGVIVERKGLSLTVHYRTDPAEEEWVRDWVGAAAHRHGLAAHPARMSWELRVPLAIDKGSVVTDLAAGLEAACFVGDDVGDLPAFAALDALQVTALKVAVRSPEMAPELAAAADLVVDGPDGALTFLRRLAG